MLSRHSIKKATLKARAITTLIIVTLLPCLAQTPKELGIGFVIASDPYQYEDGSHYQHFFVDKELKMKWSNGDITPYFYKPDYALYHFICLEKTDRYYKILINDFSTAYIPNDPHFYFKTWDMILIDASVVRLTEDNPIRDELNSASRIVPYNCRSGQLEVKDVIEKDGEYWIQVSFSPTCEDVMDQYSPRTYGWIQWRTKNKLLVDILLLC